MKFCCHATSGRFDSRLSVGEFIIAGVDPERGVLRFYYGFTSCHKADWQDLTETCYKLGDLMKEAGASNFKLCLTPHREVLFILWRKLSGILRCRRRRVEGR